ncbi:MAG: hypothetical protein Q9218_001348 [Villophora microphyllina]
MWDPDETKRVRRSELRLSSFSPDSAGSDPEAETQWRRQLDHVYKFDTNEEAKEPTPAVVNEPVEEEYDFKLFSSKTRNDAGGTTPSLPKVLLRSPSPESGGPGFVRPQRPEGHYFTGHRTTEEKKRFQDVAIEGGDVLKESQSRWLGWLLPWRVTTINIDARKRATGAATQPESEGSGKRKKMGKKRRIAVRVKLQTQRKQEEAAKVTAAEREVLEREKRNRRNREKKIKRREKARQLKQGQEDGMSTVPMDHDST